MWNFRVEIRHERRVRRRKKRIPSYRDKIIGTMREDRVSEVLVALRDFDKVLDTSECGSRAKIGYKLSLVHPQA